MNENWISIIIPCYNREKYISRTLQSVIDQTYRPLEVIIVDDGSTDGSVKILNEFKQENHVTGEFEVQLLLQNNEGANTARNKGFLESKGQFIQFLDSDDILTSKKIEVEMAKFDPNIDIVYSKAQHFDSYTGKLMDKFWGRELDGSSKDYFEFSWQTMCALYRRNTLLTHGLWDPEFSRGDDWEFQLRFVINGSNVRYYDRVHSFYRVHNDERIGSNLNQDTMISFIDSIRKVYALTQKQNLLNNYLKYRHFKRLTYCYIKSKKDGYDKALERAKEGMCIINKPIALLITGSICR